MINNKLKLIFCNFLILLSISFSISAEEKWDGFYAGVDIGYMKADDKGREHGLDGVWNLWEQNLKPEGASIGILAGHNWTFANNILLGLEGSFKKYDASDRVFQIDSSTGGDCAPATDCIFKTKTDQSFSLLGRVGYIVNEKFLAYAIGGYTTARIKRLIWDGWDQVANLHYNKWQDGWTLGAGVEYQVLESVSAKLEYKYTDLGRYSYHTPAFEGQIEKHKYDHDEINIGLNYHF